MKRIPLIPPESTSKLEKLVHKVARHNLRSTMGSMTLLNLKNGFRGMDKILTIVEVPEEKANIGNFYLVGKLAFGGVW